MIRIIQTEAVYTTPACEYAGVSVAGVDIAYLPSVGEPQVLPGYVGLSVVVQPPTSECDIGGVIVEYESCAHVAIPDCYCDCVLYFII